MTFNKINLPNLPGHFEDLDIAIYIKSGNIDIFSLWKNVFKSELVFGYQIRLCVTSSD